MSGVRFEFLIQLLQKLYILYIIPNMKLIYYILDKRIKKRIFFLNIDYHLYFMITYNLFKRMYLEGIVTQCFEGMENCSET